MSFVNNFLVDPRDFDDDDDDWLNDDFDDLQYQPAADSSCPKLKAMDQDINTTGDDDDDDDGWREVLQLREIGHSDPGGVGYSELLVTSTAFQESEEGQIISEMTESLVDVTFNDPVPEADTHADLSDEEIRLLDDLYKKKLQCRIAEANKDWGISDASGTIQVDCEPEDATGELRNDKTSKVQFSTNVQYFDSPVVDLPYETQEMTAHEMMLLKEKSGDFMEATADDANFVQYVNLRVFQTSEHEDPGLERNGNATKSTADTKVNKIVDVQIYKHDEHGDHRRLQDSRPSSSSAHLLKYSELQLSTKAEFYIPPSRQTTPLKIQDSEDTVSKLKQKVSPILKSVLDPKLLKMLCKAPTQNIAIIRELNIQIRENLDLIQRAKLPAETLKLLDELSRMGNKKKQKSISASASFCRSTVSSQMRVAEITRSKSDKKSLV